MLYGVKHTIFGRRASAMLASPQALESLEFSRFRKTEVLCVSTSSAYDCGVFSFSESRSVAIALKQITLKPQDLVLALKVAVNEQRELNLTSLGHELKMVVSAVHGSIVRCEQARLLTRIGGGIRPMKPALAEFAVHGARYAFPAMQGTLTRGTATSLAGPSLRDHFDQARAMPFVWPDPLGDAYGPGLLPLHHTVPEACRLDATLFDVLTLVDAIRAGAARERELAITFLQERLA
jgi:hypothetical protein